MNRVQMLPRDLKLCEYSSCFPNKKISVFLLSVIVFPSFQLKDLFPRNIRFRLCGRIIQFQFYLTRCFFFTVVSEQDFLVSYHGKCIAVRTIKPQKCCIEREAFVKKQNRRQF